ncbi:MAG: NnrU family protein [Paracoccaceae bacterium]|nr:NnrU family protein [Paracoccaceae bacterium]
MGWIEFTVAFAVFMGSHAVPSRPGLKAALIARLGAHGYAVGFSLVSTALLVWLIGAAGRAPYIELWPQASWMRWGVNIVMPLVVLLASFAVAAPNPFAFEGRAAGFDPDHPGIAGVVRQPLLWALGLWGGAHLLANGDLAHVILFGAFAIFAFVGQRAMEARTRHNWGGAAFDRLAARTSDWPFQALIAGRWRPQAGPSLPRLALAVGIWAALVYLHGPVIGVSPRP